MSSNVLIRNTRRAAALMTARSRMIPSEICSLTFNPSPGTSAILPCRPTFHHKINKRIIVSSTFPTMAAVAFGMRNLEIAWRLHVVFHLRNYELLVQKLYRREGGHVGTSEEDPHISAIIQKTITIPALKQS